MNKGELNKTVKEKMDKKEPNDVVLILKFFTNIFTGVILLGPWLTAKVICAVGDEASKWFIGKGGDKK